MGKVYKVSTSLHRVVCAGSREGLVKNHEKIEMNPQIMFGKPVIKNTRITVEQILRKLSGGMTIGEIINDHPHLTREDIYSAQAFAADTV